MSWLSIAGTDSSDLAAELERRVEEKISAGEFHRDNVRYIEKLDRSAISGELEVSDECLERLRRLCELWDVDLRIHGIKSHRKFLGPFIVAAKKLVFPVLRAFMKDFISQQRAFNGEVISYLAFISKK